MSLSDIGVIDRREYAVKAGFNSRQGTFGFQALALYFGPLWAPPVMTAEELA